MDKFYETIRYYIEDCRDKRLEHLPFNGPPSKTIILVSTYLLLVHKIGPWFMKNRRPFELKTVMAAYNLLQIALNALVICYVVTVTYARHYNFACQPPDFSNTRQAILESLANYFYYLLKILDLVDTMFFVLRKKNSHISVLHVYHHVSMVSFVYISVNYYPAGHAALVGIINCFVHTIMYFYYFLTAFKPELKQSIWWKKHITQIQLLQFVILMVHFLRPILFGIDCGYSIAWLYIGVIQAGIMVWMFSNFYNQAYLKPKKKSIKS